MRTWRGTPTNQAGVIEHLSRISLNQEMPILDRGDVHVGPFIWHLTDALANWYAIQLKIVTQCSVLGNSEQVVPLNAFFREDRSWV